MTLRKGESVRLPTAEVRLEFRRMAGRGIPRADACALLLAGGEPRGADDLVDAAAGVHSSGAVRHAREEGADGSVVDTLTMDLASLERAVTSVLVVVRAEGGPVGRIPELRLSAVSGHARVARLDCSQVTGGRVSVLGECYREDGGWRLRAVEPAAGTQGLLPVLRPGATRAARAAAAAPEPPTAEPASPAMAKGALRITFTPLPGPDTPLDPDFGLDVDLCALFELSDGRKGVVQPLGGAVGAWGRPPFIVLDALEDGPAEGPATGAGPDGGGDGADGGRARRPPGLTVNLDHAARFRRVLVFVTLYGADRTFAGLRGTVTLHPEHGPPLDFALDVCDVPSTACALVLLTRDGDGLAARREGHHLVPRPGLSPQRTVDYAYGWGLVWTPGPA